MNIFLWFLLVTDSVVSAAMYCIHRSRVGLLGSKKTSTFRGWECGQRGISVCCMGDSNSGICYVSSGRLLYDYMIFI